MYWCKQLTHLTTYVIWIAFWIPKEHVHPISEMRVERQALQQNLMGRVWTKKLVSLGLANQFRRMVETWDMKGLRHLLRNYSPDKKTRLARAWHSIWKDGRDLRTWKGFGTFFEITLPIQGIELILYFKGHYDPMILVRSFWSYSRHSYLSYISYLLDGYLILFLSVISHPRISPYQVHMLWFQVHHDWIALSN